MAEATRALFPEVHTEIAALAEALGLPFDPVFAWNARGDLLAVWAMVAQPCNCPALRAVIAHNEDGLPGLAGHCFHRRPAPRCSTHGHELLLSRLDPRSLLSR
jgi:hypothetical protein